MSLRVVASDVSQEIRLAFSGKETRNSDTIVGTVAEATQGAIVEAAKLLKDEGRANIAAGGFSKKWQNAWRVNIYPKGHNSINAACFGFHKIPYSLIFEEGGSIKPKHGLLWLPLRTTDRTGVKGKQLTPRQMARSGVELHTIKRPGGGPPLLGTYVRVSRSQAKGGGKLSLSLSKLKRGTDGIRGVVTSVPLFVGIPSVSIGRRFDLAGVADKVRGRLGNLYFQHLNAG